MKDKLVSDKPMVSSAQVFNLPSPPDRKVVDFVHSYRTWVYDAVSLISTGVASMELKLFKRVDRDGEIGSKEIFDHPASALIAHVNSFTTQYQLFELTETYLQLVGEAFWCLIRENGKITEIWALRPDWVTVHPSSTDFVSHYTYRPYGSGKEVRLEKDDVVPFRKINPSNPYRGFGVVKAQAMAIDINDFSDQWQRAFFYNSAIPSIIFTTDQKLHEDTIKRFMKSWEQRFQGAKKAHQIAFLGGGMKPDYVPNAIKDMDFVKLQEWTRDEILAGFKVSKANLGITEDVNRATQEATDARFTKTVIKPEMISLVTQLNEFLLPLYKEEGLFFDFVDPVPVDTDKNIAIYESGLKNGWLTINEVRNEENREPLEGGDVVYLPFNLQPIGQVVERIKGLFGKKSETQRGVLTLQGNEMKYKFRHNIPIPHKTLRQIYKDKLKADIKPDIIKLISTVMAKQEAPEKYGEVYWKEMIAQTDAWEIAMKNVVVRLFKEQEKEVIEKITGVKSLRKPIESFLFILDAAQKKWGRAITPLLSNIIIERSRKVFSELGVEATIDMASDPVVRFLQEEAGQMIKGINEVTLDRLRTQLSEGVAKKESIPELTSRVKDIFDSEARAEMIARTEVLRASNFSSDESYKQSNIVEGKEWLTAMDERVHPGCVELNGEKVLLDDTFDTEAGQLSAPPMHPRCRCTILPVLKMEVRSTNKLRQKEIELINKIKELEEISKAKYEELEKEIPELKASIIEEERNKAIKEKDELLQELKELRDKAKKL